MKLSDYKKCSVELKQFVYWSKEQRDLFEYNRIINDILHNQRMKKLNKLRKQN